jgi:hypothetical protein
MTSIGRGLCGSFDRLLLRQRGMHKNSQIFLCALIDLFWPTSDLQEGGADKMKVFISGSRGVKKLPDSAVMIWDGLNIETLNSIKAMKDRNKGVCVIVDGVFYDEENSDIIINKLTNR